MKFLHSSVSTEAKYLLTDSRYVDKATESIFFAIKGNRHDGHQFIAELINKGVREFVVEAGSSCVIDGKQVFFSIEKGGVFSSKAADADIKFWVVQNSIKALQEIADRRRRSFNLPVVGITGSNGKTIVKEWVYDLLNPSLRCVKSPRSYNSQIGVPLSVWQLDETHQVGIFEAGISQSGEMKAVAGVIQPTIGIFTNIGSAHDEGFNSRKAKIAEKLRLFANSKTLIYCLDYQEVDAEIDLLLKQINPKIELIGWSLKSTGKFPVKVDIHANQATISTVWNGKEIAVDLNFKDTASIENATHALFCYLVICGTDKLPDFSILKPVTMRLEMKHGIHDSYLIDDTYNNDLGGLEMALNFLNQHHTKRDKLLILSDVLESGLEEDKLYGKIKKLLQAKGFNQLIGIGEALNRTQPLPGLYYETTENFLDNLPIKELSGRFILVKGARTFGFERIVQRLERKIHGTVFEINLDALQKNLNYYRSKLKPPTKLMVMVKAHAYGSGSTEVAAFLQYHRVDYLAVAYTDEGVKLRENGIELPIMVLNPQPESFQNVIDFDLEPEIYSIKSLKTWLDLLDAKQNPEATLAVHLKLDTGMHRLGFDPSEISQVIRLLSDKKTVKIKSVFSHLSAADEARFNGFSRDQISLFTQMAEQIQASVSYKIDRHICNSAGILQFPEAHFEMVRLGIGIYGIEPSGSSAADLQPIGRLRTIISQIKQLQLGETVGYGRKGKVDKPTRTATIAIGYADGYDRRFSNGVGEVSVNGTLCPVIGNVCMDMTMIDVTNADCQEGDEVILFGESPTIAEVAQKIQTIPYEILTNVGERVKRVFYKE